uniref:zinc finger CCCH domain-containing protein 3 n=1 Tax=Panthera onca TaxID=9690 RepID=UPI002953A931|nr:zinc finger CCCH domain-containing protein 3 [Panthera onca]
MTSRGPGRASRTPEMEEKEQLRRQIRLLQGLIDDYKNLHGNAPAPGTSAAARWQPPAYNSSRAFGASYPRPGRRGFSLSHGPAWRKKYSLVNRPPGASDPPGDCAAQPPLRAGGSRGPDPAQYVLERQVQLSPDQNMVIKIKPPSKPGSASAAGVSRGSLEGCEDPSWSHHRPQEGEGEPPGGQQQPSRPGRAKGSCGTEDPLLVCQKEPGKPRVVKSVSSVSDSPSEPRRTVSESAVAAKARFLSPTLPQRSGAAPGRKVGSHSVASCVAQHLGDGRVNAGHPDQPASSGSVAGPARAASGPRQAREASPLVSCRTSKFRKNNYKWVAASAKSPRATRRALSPRAASETVCRAPFGTAAQGEKPQLRADPDAKPRRSSASSTLGASPSKYKWKASSPSASSSSSFRWQSEAGSKDHASQLPPRFPPGDRPAVGPSGLKPLFSETTLSAYKVKSRTKIIRRRGGASLPCDKKNGAPPAATAKSQLSLRRRQAPRGKSSPVLRKNPNKGLAQVTRHRLCCLPPGRAHPPTKEASSVHTLRTPPTSKVIKTRYRIVKKTPVSPLSAPQSPLSLPSWRSRRLSLSRQMGPRFPTAWDYGVQAPPGSGWWPQGLRVGLLWDPQDVRLGPEDRTPLLPRPALGCGVSWGAVEAPAKRGFNVFVLSRAVWALSVHSLYRQPEKVPGQARLPLPTKALSDRGQRSRSLSWFWAQPRGPLLVWFGPPTWVHPGVGCGSCSTRPGVRRGPKSPLVPAVEQRPQEQMAPQRHRQPGWQPGKPRSQQRSDCTPSSPGRAGVRAPRATWTGLQPVPRDLHPQLGSRDSAVARDAQLLSALLPAPRSGTGQTLPTCPLSPGFDYPVTCSLLITTVHFMNSSPLGHSRLDPASSCSRSLASRAVQRSLAIVRQARQRRRKQQQEYCMYYNRFGRCNHGEHCPYIHDPDKVAVCTRFLRGTCKKTDGTCPFSHHVSKEKMPVCSYFLKGICSNSNCPYSHVYVSRKAEVCTDFLKGYCPLGAKCKKKHTLLCPDFSRRGVCPRGAQCQLLHRNQKRPGRRAASAPAPEPSSASPKSKAASSHGPRKSSAAQRPTRQTPSSPTSVAAGSASPPSSPRVLAAASGSPLSAKPPSSPSPSSTPSSSSLLSPSSPTPPSPSLSLDQEELSLREEAASAATSSSSLPKLPSFISLQSSPSPGGQPRARTPRSPPTKDSGKTLHIKPRL